MDKSKKIFDIPTHMTKQERILLTGLAYQLPDGATIVEIGSYLGASTCFLADGIKQSGKIAKVYAIDPWTNIAMSEGKRETYSTFLDNTQYFQDIVTPLRGLSTDFVAEFRESIDLLFIDGDHSYEGASTDLKNWLPKVKERGIVVCHDYSWATGVRQAVREYLAPLQIDGGQQLDGTYWTRISHKRLHTELELTVAIPTYLRCEYVLDALHSVMQQETDFAFEILVLDNDCDLNLQQTIEDIAREAPVPVLYIPVEELGLHNGRNLGAITARGNVVVYIDDDVIVPQGWLNAIYQPFSDPHIGGVGGKVLPQWEVPPPEWLQALDPSYFSLLDLGDRDRDFVFPETPYGCNMAYRRELLLSLGGFTPDGIGGTWIEWQRGDGETGFAYKIYNECYRLAYCPRAWLHHRIPAQRQTLQFAYRRAIKGALSNAYSLCRRVKLSRTKTCGQVVNHSVKAAIACVKRVLVIPLAKEKRLSSELQLIHYGVMVLYQLRVLIDPGLRQWIAKPDYWPTQTISTLTPADFEVAHYDP